MTSPQEGITLTKDQAEALWGALVMRPTVERQLEQLIAIDPAWKAQQGPMEAHYNQLERVYKAYGEHLYKPLPPRNQIPIDKQELLVHTSSGSLSFNPNGTPRYASPE